jgi:8-amino-7-oxononanoate synthase
MLSFDDTLQTRLAGLREQNLFRELRRVDSAQGPRIEIGGEKLLNFSSNDYLGLAGHPALKEAAIRAVEKFGAGAGASRLVCGSLAPFHELEEALAAFKKTEAALTFSTGYAAAVGTITSLAGKDDIILLDKLVHACIVDAAKLSGAKLRVFAHNDLEDLEDKLKWAAKQKAETQNLKPEILIVTESVFSMDGDTAPLREIVALKEKYGAWLMVDEAHATGLYGENRRGLAEELRVSNRIEIQMGTLGKALGASGGYICGSRALIDFLVNRARSFIFSTAPVPAAAAAATAGIKLVRSEGGLTACKRAWMVVGEIKRALETSGLETEGIHGPIMPYLIGDESETMRVAKNLFDDGFYVPAIRYPTVAKGKARLRFTVTAKHDFMDAWNVIKCLERHVNKGK